MPRSRSNRYKRKIPPSRIKSSPRSKGLRLCPPLVTVFSRSRMPGSGRKCLRHRDNAQHDQQHRPQIAKPKSRIFADQENYANRNQQNRSSHPVKPAMRARTSRLFYFFCHRTLLRILLQTVLQQPGSKPDQRKRPDLVKPVPFQQAEILEQEKNAQRNQNDCANWLTALSFDQIRWRRL